MNSISNVKRYVIFSYLLFWSMVLFICGSAFLFFHASPFVMRLLSNLCAWSPTMVLLLMFNKLRPNQTRRAFFKECFSGKIKPVLLLSSTLIVTCGSLFAVLIASAISQRNFASYFSMSNYSLLASIFFSLLSGPTGEEAGWRGYLRIELNHTYPFLKSSIIQGIIWALWHIVIWMVEPDYTNLLMIPVIISNIVVMTCLTIIMNVVLDKQNNLLYSISIHFAFTFIYNFLVVDIWFYIALIVVYLLIASGFLWYKQTSEKKHK